MSGGGKSSIKSQASRAARLPDHASSLAGPWVVPQDRAAHSLMKNVFHTLIGRAWPAAAITLMMASCATRTKSPTLGASWPETEPKMDMRRYECVQRRPGQRNDVAVAVAISGGGMRAANFAAGVLVALERVPVRGCDGRESNLLREVDYFSTASGGGLAAASYLMHLAEYKRLHPDDAAGARFSFADGGKSEANAAHGGRSWREALARNYQASLVRALLNPFLRGSTNRGDVLERRLGESVVGEIDGRTPTLGDVFVPPGTTPRLPYWVANATVYENGAIFPFTPDMLEKYGITEYCHDEKYRPLQSSFDMPLSVGLKASASFPVAIPTSNLKSKMDRQNSTLHLMDGGVADNLGLISALRLLNQDPAQKKVLIVIDAYNGMQEPFSRGGPAPGIFTTALRTTSISLDSAHQRFGDLIALGEHSNGMRCAIIDFHQARQKDVNEQQIVAATSDPGAVRQEGNVDKRDETSPQTIDAVFTQALGMGTWFKIRKEDQNALLTTGENAIYQQINAGSGSGRRLLPRLQKIKELF